MSNIVQKLRLRPCRYAGETEIQAKERRQLERDEAADTIEALRGEVERLKVENRQLVVIEQHLRKIVNEIAPELD